MFSSRPLPQNPYSALNEKRWHDAFNQCLQIQPLGQIDDRDKDLVYARILGYLMLEAPTPESRDYVSQEILNCNRDRAKLHEFAEVFMLTVLPLFKNNCSSPEIQEDPTEFFATEAETTPRDHRSARRSALHRDNYRCMVIRAYDFNFYDFVLTSAQRAEIDMEPNISGTVTKAWHIIPPLPSRDSHSLDRASTFFQRFFSFSFDEFRKSGHSLTNVLTLARHVGELLSDCHIWFRTVPGDENAYELHSWHPSFLTYLPPNVRFSTKTNLALPDARYLEIHAAICRIARWSGASQRAVLLECQEQAANNEEG